MKLFQNDPFTLMTFHKVLISTALAMSLFYGIWEFTRNYAREPGGTILRASLAWIITIGLGIYLWRIRRKK